MAPRQRPCGASSQTSPRRVAAAPAVWSRRPPDQSPSGRRGEAEVLPRRPGTVASQQKPNRYALAKISGCCRWRLAGRLDGCRGCAYDRCSLCFVVGGGGNRHCSTGMFWSRRDSPLSGSRATSEVLTNLLARGTKHTNNETRIKLSVSLRVPVPGTGTG